MDQRLKELINKLQTDSIDSTEYEELISLFNTTPKNEVDNIFSSLWMTESSKFEKQFKSKDAVLESMRRRIKPSKRFHLTKWSKIAIAACIPLLLCLIYLLKGFDNQTIEFCTLAELGGKSYIMLPDSTEVWLNSESELKYSSDFNLTNRTVELAGEAFFKVKKASDTKFTVKMGSFDVVVLGTTFNVSSYKAEQIVQVALIEGAVSLEDQKTDQLIKMKPNQLFTLNKQNEKWSLENVDTSLYGLWHKDKLAFHDTPSLEVFRQLEKWYGVSITASNHNESIVYGFTLQDESIEEILDLMNMITPIEYDIAGKEVVVKYK